MRVHLFSIDPKNKDGSLAYAWEFSGKELKEEESIDNIDLQLSLRKATEEIIDSNTETSTEIDTNAPMSVDGLIQNSIPKDSTAVVISFGHSGDLPGTASVRLNVGQMDGVKPGDVITLYYFNEEVGKLEKLEDSTYTVDEKGFVVVNISHCSEYVLLSEEPVSDALYSPNITLITAPLKLVAGEKYTFEIDVTDYDVSTIRWYTTKRSISTVGKNDGKTSAEFTAKCEGKEKIQITVQRYDGKLDIYYFDITVDAAIQKYIVKKGDTLWKIALKYGCKIADIVAWNDIQNPDLILINQELIIK